MSAENLLKILLEVDRISDEADNESTLTLQLVSYLTEEVKADLGAFSLPDEQEEGKWKLQAISDKSEILKKISLNDLNEIDGRAKNSKNSQLIKEEIILKNGGAIHVVAVPQRVNEELFGVLLLAKEGREFEKEEIQIVEIASTRMDSALKHINTLIKLRQETKALRTIMLVDRIRDTSSTMEEMLDLSLTQVTNVIEAQTGFIMLYDKLGNRLELKALTGREHISSEKSFDLIYRYADESINSGGIVQWGTSDGEVRAGLGVPLILNEKIVGVLGVANPLKKENFSTGDRKLLEAIASQMDTAIFERLETQRIRDVFGRNVGDKVMNRLLQISDRDLLEGDRVELTILFSDIRGFTKVSASTDPKTMESVINEHFEAMIEVILKYEGTLDKFLGDGIMAFFNAPGRQKNHAEIAVNTALAMQVAHKKLVPQWNKKGLPDMPIGIGISTGEVIVGNFGSHEYTEYSVIGSKVNLASRLCGDAEGNQTLIDERTFDLIKGKFDVKELLPKEFKGFNDPLVVWQVNN